MTSTLAYAAHTAKARLAPFAFECREPGSHDVEIDIAYCGVDIIRDADGKLWVLEVNSIPAWRGLQRAISVNATQMVNIAQILVDDFIGR